MKKMILLAMTMALSSTVAMGAMETFTSTNKKLQPGQSLSLNDKRLECTFVKREGSSAENEERATFYKKRKSGLVKTTLAVTAFEKQSNTMIGITAQVGEKNAVSYKPIISVPNREARVIEDTETKTMIDFQIGQSTIEVTCEVFKGNND